jgi:hypothetical protein
MIAAPGDHSWTNGDASVVFACFFLQACTWTAGDADLPMLFERRRVVIQASESVPSRGEAVHSLPRRNG